MTEPTEREKMLRGDLYLAADPELTAARTLARQRLARFNGSDPGETALRESLLRELLGQVGEGLTIEPPFYCDYGTQIKVGCGVFFNFGCTVLDVAPVTIGNHVLVGPHVRLLTPLHPLNAEERRTGLESARPIVIEDDVWLGGGVTVNPGVTVGARSVIGSGSVVTRDIPADVLAAGNPCRVIRRLDGEKSEPQR